MKQLETTIQKLKTDALHAITVLDTKSANRICLNKTGADLANEFGSVEAFFEDLNAKGITSFRVFERRKSGSAFRPMGDYIVDIVGSPQAQTQAAVPDLFNAPAQPGFGLMAGLNMMDAAYKMQDHTRLVTENERYRSENERLKDQVSELKETILKNQYSADKSKSTNELLSGLAPLLMPLLSKSTGGDPGLAAPAEQLRPVQSAFMQVVRSADDGFLQDLYAVATGLQDEKFDQEITDLLTKYNLIPKVNAV